MSKAVAIGWFPVGELEKALAMWPQLLAGWGVSTHGEYCRALDHQLRELELVPGSDVLLAKIEVKHFVKWCGREDVDPAAPDSRAAYAREVATRGRVQEWPPAPSARCWCGRDKPYEDCCGT